MYFIPGTQHPSEVLPKRARCPRPFIVAPAPHCCCDETKKRSKRSQSSSGDVAGVGVSLSFDSDRDLPLVVGIEKGTPAEEAGLQVKKCRRTLKSYHFTVLRFCKLASVGCPQ